MFVYLIVCTMKNNHQPLLNPADIIQRKEKKFLTNRLGDETVMMDMDSGDYIGVNSVGTDIWNLLSEPVSVNSLIDKIQSMYEVTGEQCTSEVNVFLSKMLEHDMLAVYAA